MKYYISILCLLFLTACKNGIKQNKSKQMSIDDGEFSLNSIKYPQNLRNVFDAHGGLENWKKMKTLTFEMLKADAKEIHTIDLPTRKDKIDFSGVSMGYNGSKTWIMDEQESYKGNAFFYHNVMFYFYAMPYVLADDGIIYGKTDDLIFEGKNYPGVSVSYEQGVGVSSNDEYFIHFNPETYQMEWLGYTVSYGTGKKSNNIRWIHYNEWATVNGILLPKELTWYTYEGRTINAPRNSRQFKNIVLSEIAKSNSFYEKPAKAVFVEE